MRAVRTAKKLPRRKKNTLEQDLIEKGYRLDKAYDINPFGLEVIIKLMKDKNLGYETMLHEITFPLTRICGVEKREQYQIDNIQDIRKILGFIRENKLLDEKDGD